eukprot:1144860-Pelagomonas_calceolata.AAC.2
MAITDPVSGRAALLLLQTDITSRAELEARMAALTESQLAMLEQMFPRWVCRRCYRWRDWYNATLTESQLAMLLQMVDVHLQGIIHPGAGMPWVMHTDFRLLTARN